MKMNSQRNHKDVAVPRLPLGYLPAPTINPSAIRGTVRIDEEEGVAYGSVQFPEQEIVERIVGYRGKVC
jgi:hypothetical protein